MMSIRIRPPEQTTVFSWCACVLDFCQNAAPHHTEHPTARRCGCGLYFPGVPPQLGAIFENGASQQAGQGCWQTAGKINIGIYIVWRP